jgi:hypothetical protein
VLNAFAAPLIPLSCHARFRHRGRRRLFSRASGEDQVPGTALVLAIVYAPRLTSALAMTVDACVNAAIDARFDAIGGNDRTDQRTSRDRENPD